MTSSWLGIEPGTSRTQSQHSTTRLSRRQFTHLVIAGANITPIYVTQNQTVKSPWITFIYSFNIYHQSSSIFFIVSTCKNHVYVETTVMWWRTPWFVLERCTNSSSGGCWCFMKRLLLCSFIIKIRQHYMRTHTRKRRAKR